MRCGALSRDGHHILYRMVLGVAGCASSEMLSVLCDYVLNDHHCDTHTAYNECICLRVINAFCLSLKTCLRFVSVVKVSQYKQCHPQQFETVEMVSITLNCRRSRHNTT
jgi:hypothetical protein